MQIKLYSFGLKLRPTKAKTGQAETFDVRFLPNPWSRRDLRSLDGRRKEVQDYLGRSGIEAAEAVAEIAERAGAVAAFCVGGKHRSVAVVEMAAEILRLHGHQVEVEHLSLHETVEGA